MCRDWGGVGGLQDEDWEPRRYVIASFLFCFFLRACLGKNQFESFTSTRSTEPVFTQIFYLFYFIFLQRNKCTGFNRSASFNEKNGFATFLWPDHMAAVDDQDYSKSHGSRFLHFIFYCPLVPACSLFSDYLEPLF